MTLLSMAYNLIMFPQTIDLGLCFYAVQEAEESGRFMLLCIAFSNYILSIFYGSDTIQSESENGIRLTMVEPSIQSDAKEDL